MEIKIKFNNDIEKLRKMLNIPKLYLSDYFGDIKSKIDLHFVQSNESDKETWIQMIKKVEIYESIFLKELKINDQLKMELSKQIEYIQAKVNEIIFEEIHDITKKVIGAQFNEIKELIEKQNETLKKCFLSNKTFLLMKSYDDRLILVYYADKYLNEEQIEKLKEEANFDLTNESIKLKHLTELILLSDQFMIDIDFKNNRSIDLSNKENDSYYRNYDYQDNDNDLTNENKQMKVIKSDLFNDFIGLEFVSLANNSIDSIESNAFQNLKNLKYLFLNNNKIKEINDSLFSGLANLKSLNISKNKISAVKFETFKDLVNLHQLDLGNNSLSFEVDCFKNLVELKELFLNNNHLDSINGNIFVGLNNIQWLDLSNNNLKSIPVDCFKSLLKLETLNVEKNPLVEFKLKKNKNIALEKSLAQYNNNDKILDRNLLKNSCATFGFHFWLELSIDDLNNSNSIKELIKNIKNTTEFSISGFDIELGGVFHGAKKILNSETKMLYSNFVTSYNKGYKLQLIDLALEEGIDDSFIKNMKPDIEIGEQYVARWDCGSEYAIKVFLINKDFEKKDEFKFKDRFDQWYKGDWRQVIHKFKYKDSYDSLRYILFYHSGNVNYFICEFFKFNKKKGIFLRTLNIGLVIMDRK